MAVCIAARVVGFDPARGTGSVVTDEGSELAFHAARITNGTRAIDVGARVVVDVGPGPAPGTWEAVRVVRV
jgi:hypothetical protein